MSDQEKFAVLSAARRIWAVGSIHGERQRLEALHDSLWPRLETGDRLVYLGNILGRGSDVEGTLNELLAFRCGVMALEPAEAPHVIFLRGGQEEMWQKLLQLQFATDPRGVLDWMLAQGVGATLKAYGSSAEEALQRVRGGAVGLTRWTQDLRRSMQNRDGHVAFMTALRRACVAGDERDQDHLLLVNAGLDPTRPLEAQRDSFWWSSGGFGRLSAPYGHFARVVRGFAPGREADAPGIVETDHTVTIDAGCGFGGPLAAGCFDLDGRMVDRIEA